MQPGTRYPLEVNPKIPKRLARMEELAANLWYSWDRPTRAIFARLNPALWDAVGHSPKAMLKRIDEQRLIDAASDPAFLDSMTRVLAAFDAYLSEPPFKQNSGGFKREDLVAYFCAEFGIHESLPIYSGGLGILAGDHCKAASDFQLPLVALSRKESSLRSRGDAERSSFGKIRRLAHAAGHSLHTRSPSANPEAPRATRGTRE